MTSARRIPLVVVDPPEHDDRQPGMMWRYPKHDLPDRECWWISLPPSNDQGKPGHPSQLSWMTTDRASSPPHQLWNVSGKPPNITVTPSIDIMRFVMKDGKSVREGSYFHGFITNGIITDA